MTFPSLQEIKERVEILEELSHLNPTRNLPGSVLILDQREAS
jgi:hypothetical protein